METLKTGKAEGIARIESGAGVPGARRTMQKGQQRLRMAVGVFDRAESLTRVLDGLAAIEPEPPGVVLLSTCLDLPGASSGKDILHRQTHWPEGWPVIAAVGKDGARIPEGGHEHIVDFESWIGPAMSRDLSRRLSEGACLLFAATRDSAEEMRVCQTLIRHSVGQVQVHDYVE